MSAHTPVVTHRFNWFPVLTTILAVGLILAILVVAVPRINTGPVSVASGNDAGLQRGLDASAARYTAMAEAYFAQQEALQRSVDASAARYTALAEAYFGQQEALQRSFDASAARYTALAEAYGARSDNLQRGLDASAARYTALAEYYGNGGQP